MRQISNLEKKRIFTEIQKLGIALSSDATTETFQIYTEILFEYGEANAIRAIKEGMRKFRFFPKPVELIDLINPKPQRQDADLLAGEIISAVRRYGFYQGAIAKEQLGEEAWNVVILIGGWSTLCDTKENQLGTLRAQVRDLGLSVLNGAELKLNKEKRISYTGNNILRIGEIN